ncbi:MAG: hypothetical protein ACSLEN_07065 [Candidatus Malihini olakiniferum]
MIALTGLLRLMSPASFPQQSNNFNAPRAITSTVVLYVFRTLVVPEGSMVNSRYPAAVVTGNVEFQPVSPTVCMVHWA